MNHTLAPDFVELAKEIEGEHRSEEEWAEVESSDMFQRGAYVGGFDATEREFTFSVYEAGQELWFQLALEEVLDIANGRRSTVEIRPAG